MQAVRLVQSRLDIILVAVSIKQMAIGERSEDGLQLEMQLDLGMWG